MRPTNSQRIVVDRGSERRFRRRAIRRLPHEYQENLWGRQRGNIIYVHAFVPITQTATPTAIYYDDDEMHESAEDAKEHRLVMLGSIHSHPDRHETLFSEGDLRQHLLDPDIIMGICAIEDVWKGDTLVRRRCHVAYWPGVLPMSLEYTDWD